MSAADRMAHELRASRRKRVGFDVLAAGADDGDARLIASPTRRDDLARAAQALGAHRQARLPVGAAGWDHSASPPLPRWVERLDPVPPRRPAQRPRGPTSTPSPSRPDPVPAIKTTTVDHGRAWWESPYGHGWCAIPLAAGWRVAREGSGAGGVREGRVSTMFERRDRRRLHARARALGVPLDQAGRRATPRRRPTRPLPEPVWPRTALPNRDDTPATITPTPQAPAAVCCTVTRDRQVTDGGTVMLLTRHAIDCPVWSAR